MPVEVAPDLFRLSIPLPGNPLGGVNAYAIRAVEGLYLVDCGWNTPHAYSALAAQLAPLGGIAAVRRLLVTHLHPDHYGLADRLVEESGAQLAMHQLDAQYLGARYGDVRALMDGMAGWLRLNGVIEPELTAMNEGSLGLLQRVGARRPDILLEGGEMVDWGRYHFKVFWTPGHSAGLVCLYDAADGCLLSSDHILERISPHVGLHLQSRANPLADYLQSLRALRDLPIRQILPGHGLPFYDLAGRVDALLAHHRDRLAAIGDLVADVSRTAYEVSERLPWRRSVEGWRVLAPFQRRMALTEVSAHLEYLRQAGQIDSYQRHDHLLYGRNRSAEHHPPTG